MGRLVWAMEAPARPAGTLRIRRNCRNGSVRGHRRGARGGWDWVCTAGLSPGLSQPAIPGSAASWSSTCPQPHADPAAGQQAAASCTCWVAQWRRATTSDMAQTAAYLWRTQIRKPTKPSIGNGLAVVSHAPGVLGQASGRPKLRMGGQDRSGPCRLQVVELGRRGREERAGCRAEGTIFSGNSVAEAHEFPCPAGLVRSQNDRKNMI